MCLLQWIEQHDAEEYVGEMVHRLRVPNDASNMAICDKLEACLRALASDGVKIPILLEDACSLTMRDAASLQEDAKLRLSFDIDTVVVVADSLEFFGHLQFTPRMPSDW